MKKKQLLQPALWMRTPKMGAKMGRAKYCDELKIADARPRSDVGNQAETMRLLPGDYSKPARIGCASEG